MAQWWLTTQECPTGEREEGREEENGRQGLTEPDIYSLTRESRIFRYVKQPVFGLSILKHANLCDGRLMDGFGPHIGLDE